ncbi:MAG: putrescine export ABC transporter permease SapB, partial [Enterobacteriaceae bacterium]
MTIFILRRLALFLITLFILTLVSFCLAYYTPYPPLQGDNAPEAWWYYISQLLQGNFGHSIINGQSIVSQLKEVLPATLQLCVIALVLAFVCGVPLGIVAGINRMKWPDITISSVALLGFSIPVFWLALLLMLFFSLQMGWLPVSGRIYLLYQLEPVTGFSLIDAWLSDSPYRHEMIVSTLQHMILPVSVLTLTPMMEVIRLMNISTSEAYEQNYIKAAEIRGLSTLQIIRRHLLGNTLPPLIAKLGLQFSTMLNLALIIEVVFNWPGIGRWVVSAIRQQDYAAVSAGVLVIGTLVILIGTLSD